jgi:serine/threonine protein kinase
MGSAPPAPPAWLLPETVRDSCCGEQARQKGWRPLFHLQAAQSIAVWAGVDEAVVEATAGSPSSSSSSSSSSSLPALLDLVLRLTAYDPDRRPSAEEMAAHPFVSASTAAADAAACAADFGALCVCEGWG